MLPEDGTRPARGEGSDRGARGGGQSVGRAVGKVRRAGGRQAGGRGWAERRGQILGRRGRRVASGERRAASGGRRSAVGRWQRRPAEGGATEVWIEVSMRLRGVAGCGCVWTCAGWACASSRWWAGACGGAGACGQSGAGLCGVWIPSVRGGGGVCVSGAAPSIVDLSRFDHPFCVARFAPEACSARPRDNRQLTQRRTAPCR